MFNFTQLSNRRIGEIRFDAITTEDHQSELSITENPIESGALIADHAVIQPKQVTINGIMVDHDHASLGLDIPYFGEVRMGIDFLNHFPLPIKVVTQTAQTMAKATRVFSQVSGALNQAENTVRAIAPWLPNTAFSDLIFGDSGGGRVQKCYSDLLACQKSGETIDIQTGFHLYKNMLIQSIAVNQTADGSATFTITAREIFIVDTQTVKSQQKNSPAGKKKRGRAATQAASKTQNGNVQIKAEPAREKTQARKTWERWTK